MQFRARPHLHTFSHNLTYTYDSNNRLTKVTDDTGYAKYSYDKNNRILTETMYNSSYSAARKYTAYTYYDSGMLNTKKNYRYSSASSSYLIDDYILTYHSDGNIATVDNNDAVTSYIYDNAGRLTSESIDGTVKASYTYDARGNRATMTEPDRVTTYSYNKNNRIGNAITEGDGIYIYHYYDYDKNGNLKEDHNYDYMRNYTYNLFGNMVSSRTVDGAIIDIDTYTYDGNGIRTSKTVDGVTTNFINDGAYVVGEVSGDSIIKYTYGTGLISINNNGTVGYYHTDEHGNVSAISDTSRKVVADYDFDAFGNETVSTDTYYNPMRYCGEYFDAETGNIYLRARYYDPSIGRFISEDPIKDGTNWYVYCSNNPIAFVDPSGLSGIMPDGSYYITHPLDEQLLKLKQEYETASPERQAEIASEAQNIRDNNVGGVDWSVESFNPLEYYMIDTDVTSRLNNLMESVETKNKFKRYLPESVLYVDFALMVMPGGKYDLKSKPEWQGREHYLYEGEIIWYDDPGNILYGYLGKVMGFEDDILKSAAGAVQIATETSSWSYVLSYFDDPKDQKAIQKGIDIFKDTHSWIWW